MPDPDEDYTALPQPPTHGLLLDTGCSGDVDHVVLGHLTRTLAGRFGAPVDFTGVLRCPAVTELPGTLREVTYSMPGSARTARAHRRRRVPRSLAAAPGI